MLFSRWKSSSTNHILWLAICTAAVIGGIALADTTAGDKKASPEDHRNFDSSFYPVRSDGLGKVFERPAPAYQINASQTASMVLTEIHVVGSVTTNAETFKPLYAEYVGKPVTETDVLKIADRIDEFLFDRGIFARAVVPPQRVKDGVFTIRVVEHYISELSIAGDATDIISKIKRDLNWLLGQRPTNLTTLRQYLLRLAETPNVVVKVKFQHDRNTPGAIQMNMLVTRRRIFDIVQEQNDGKILCRSFDSDDPKCVALVIGNSGYPESPLSNPINDADLIARTLQNVGFHVVSEHDLNHTDFRTELEKFSGLIARSEVVVIYYAGHAVDIEGQNYLVPVDANLASSADLHWKGIPLQTVLDSVRNTPGVKLVFLDACREFLGHASRDTSKGLARGLAPVDPIGDTMVMFAAKAGTLAYDGTDEPNSPFAQAVSKEIARGYVDIRLLYGLVHDDVREATKGQQEPAIYGSFSGAPLFFEENDNLSRDINTSRFSDFLFAGGRITKDTSAEYVSPPSLQFNQWALGGQWTERFDGVVLDKAPGKIAVRFHARTITLVAGSEVTDRPLRFRVTIDGAVPGAAHGRDVTETGEGSIEWDSKNRVASKGRLIPLQLIQQTGIVIDHTLEIEFLDPGARAARFSFE